MKLWWVLKSPWAKKWGRLNSVFNYIVSSFSRRFDSTEISLCIASAGRMEMLEHVFIPSYLALDEKKQVSVHLACPKDEVRAVETLCKQFNVQFTIIPCAESFTRSGYLNMALKHAKSEFIFISDVDVQLPTDLVQLYFRHVREKQAWFPIVRMLDENKNDMNDYPEGVGLVGFKQKSNFILNESFKTWGNEDWDFLYQLYQSKIYPIRSRGDNFLHHYHEPADKINYKKSW